MTEQTTLEINGESRNVPVPCNVLQLLEYLEIGQDRIAIEINRRIVRRRDWESTQVQERDQIEIVQFVGGG